MALSQHEVAQANMLQQSILDHAQFFMMILLSNQLLTVLHLFRREIAGQNNSRVQRMITVIRYYTRLFAFCYLRLDHVYVEEAELVGIRRNFKLNYLLLFIYKRYFIWRWTQSFILDVRKYTLG